MSLSFAVLLDVIYIYFLYGMGRFIENYDYASPDKLASQNGLNLSFLRFSSDQWHYFCKTLARRYYNFAAAICLCVNAVALLLFHADTRLLTLVTFVGFLILEIGTLVLMAVRTRRRIM